MNTNRILKLALSALLAVPALLAHGGVANAQQKHFRIHNDGGSRATFVSDATLETINGVTSAVTGDLRFDPANLSSASGTISIPVASIRTGVDLRDEHLRGADWLDAAHHANATFEITSVTGASTLTPNQEARLQLHGRFTIHGVTRNVVARARIKWIPLTAEMRGTPGITGDVLRGRARFTIQLSDFGINVPAVVRLKVSNDITVTVNLRAMAE
ncbi:MAG: YceI family protein [Deltaproteobacteria bacterium]|nr:YceI family protein [Deltaproteobacteria bacterium]